MYEKFFYLNEKPFHITPNPGFLYLSKSHREAIELLSHGVNQKRGFILLTGEVGTGKTTISKAILDRFFKTTESALILNPLVSDIELLTTITEDFGLKVEKDSVKSHLDELNSFLLDVAQKGGNAVVIIDEAQNLSPKTMEMVRLLSNLETDREKLLQIVMVGQPELREKLSLPELRQLNQRIIVRHHMEPLSFEETEGYIQNRIFVAGGRGGVRFSPEAMRLIFAGSKGVPRMINIICDRMLTAAFVSGTRAIDGIIASRALDELKKEGCIAKEEKVVLKESLFRRIFLRRLFASN